MVLRRALPLVEPFRRQLERDIAAFYPRQSLPFPFRVAGPSPGHRAGAPTRTEP